MKEVGQSRCVCRRVSSISTWSQRCGVGEVGRVRRDTPSRNGKASLYVEENERWWLAERGKNLRKNQDFWVYEHLCGLTLQYGPGAAMGKLTAVQPKCCRKTKCVSKLQCSQALSATDFIIYMIEHYGKKS